MARIKFSGLIESIQGSIGGTTFQRSGHGFTVKNWSQPKRSANSRQSVSRNQQKRISNAWQNLTDVDRTSWREWVQVNNITSRHNRNSLSSGLSAFQMYNRFRLLNHLFSIKKNPFGQSGINWSLESAASNNAWRSVAYGNGLFVAVSSTGTGDRVMTSPDGITWTSRVSAADNNWFSVTYGNGLFVAVSTTGSGDRVMTSPDGITWTSRVSAADNNWFSVTYGNGLFVAVSTDNDNNQAMTSPNGITWTLRSTPTTNNWFSVTYGNGLFVAVSTTGSGDRVMTSPDGITWTSRISAADKGWFSVTFGNNLFVAVAINGTGNRVMTSPDGITWTSQFTPLDNSWRSVTYGNGLFVAVSSTGTGDRVMTSPDGITWTSRVSAADIDWFSVTFGNNLFVAVAITGSNDRVMSSVLSSQNLINFTETSVSIARFGTSLNVSITDEPDGSDWIIALYIGAPQGQSQLSSRSTPVFMTNFNPGDNSPIDIATAYISRYGQLPSTDSRVPVKMVLLSTLTAQFSILSHQSLTVE